MTLVISNGASGTTPCRQCPLNANSYFRPLSEKQLGFLSKFKVGELNLDRGASILVEGEHSPHMFTLLRGWTFRFKSLPDGRRQVLNYCLPGDLLGLQNTLTSEMQHSVEALTRVTLCVFQKNRVEEIFRNHPHLAFDTTWIAARQERILDENLLSVGRRSALERTANLLTLLAKRVLLLQKQTAGQVLLPFTQSHVADTLGLSTVHTNKTLKKLSDRGLIRWRDGGCEVLDLAGLADVALWDDAETQARPFI